MSKEYSIKEGEKGMDMLSKERKEGFYKRGPVTERKVVTVDISLKTFLIVLSIIGAVYFGSRLLDVALILFFGFIISSASLPLIRWVMEKGTSKKMSIFLVYFIGLLIITSLMLLVIIPSASQFAKLFTNIPDLTEGFFDSVDGFELFGYTLDASTVEGYLKGSFDSLGSWAGRFDAFGTVSSALEITGKVIVTIFTSILMSVYIVWDHDNFVDLVLLRIINEEQRRRVRKLVLDVEEKLGSWLIGQGTLSLIIGVMVWVFLTIAGIPFALPLALLAALMESIPSLGPTISSIPAILVAFLTGGIGSGLITLAGYVVIQQIENTFIVPKVMSNAVGLKPIVVLIGVISGFALAGPIGALLAVPVMVLLQIGYEFYVDLQKLRAKGIV